MASKFESSSISHGSESICDVFCDYCKGKTKSNAAQFYCKDCFKMMHMWPISLETLDAFEQCRAHQHQKLKLFCMDHCLLLCDTCFLTNHKECNKVELIYDIVKELEKSGNFDKISVNLEIQTENLRHTHVRLEEEIELLHQTYITSLEKIDTIRKTLNETLDKIQRNTISSLDKLLSFKKSSINIDKRNSLEYIKKMQCLQNELQFIDEKREVLSYRIYKKCVEAVSKAEAWLNNIGDTFFRFVPDSALDLLNLTSLGNFVNSDGSTVLVTDKGVCDVAIIPEVDVSDLSSYGNIDGSSILVADTGICDVANIQGEDVQYSVPGKYERNVFTQSSLPFNADRIIGVYLSLSHKIQLKKDTFPCSISGICAVATGKLLISDCWNNRVKLLNRDFKVKSHIKMHGVPRSMCSIDGCQVAVAVDMTTKHEIIFIMVKKGRLEKTNTQTVQHKCIGIAYHQKNMYIASGRALYHYTLYEKLGRLMYGDNRSGSAVTSCAVSPNGDRIYVVNSDTFQLVTLSSNGEVISTLTDPSLKSEYEYGISNINVHVTNLGQLLVCGGNSIIQVDRDGKKSLDEIVTKMDTFRSPASVYYCDRTAALVVGMWNDNNILVFSTRSTDLSRNTALLY